MEVVVLVSRPPVARTEDAGSPRSGTADEGVRSRMMAVRRTGGRTERLVEEDRKEVVNRMGVHKVVEIHRGAEIRIQDGGVRRAAVVVAVGRSRPGTRPGRMRGILRKGREEGDLRSRTLLSLEM